MRVKLFGFDGCGKMGPGCKNFAVGSSSSCLRIVLPCGGVVLLRMLLGLRLAFPFVLGIRFVVVAALGLSVDACGFVHVRVFGDLLVASGVAFLLFGASGGWNSLKTNDASLLYGPTSIDRTIFWRFVRSVVDCLIAML